MTDIADTLRAHLLHAAGCTPGPWDVQPVKSGSAQGPWIVTAAQGKTQITGAVENEHDARLIAALPDFVRATQLQFFTSPQPGADAEDTCLHCGCHVADDASGVW